ncbi:serine hydrolase [Streptomyces sp. NPDC059533]|uniref:serine hydrolase n=1 Tax=Streptomyces sp. NPDC059533 TaxID=3346858 RepID=UPI0036B6EF4F
MLRALLRPGRLAQGHDGRLRPTPPWNLADLAGAGGLWSTAADLASYVRAQLDCGGPAELAEAIRLSRQVEDHSNRFARMHLGWTARRLHPRQGTHLQIRHNGGTGGFSSFVGFDPETGTAVIVLSNTRRSVDAPPSNCCAPSGARPPPARSEVHRHPGQRALTCASSSTRRGGPVMPRTDLVVLGVSEAALRKHAKGLRSTDREETNHHGDHDSADRTNAARPPVGDPPGRPPSPSPGRAFLTDGGIDRR